MHAHTHIHSHACTHTHTLTRMHTHNTHAHTCTHTCTLTHTHTHKVEDSRESCAPPDDLDGMAGALARALAMRSNVMQHSGRLLWRCVPCHVTIMCSTHSPVSFKMTKTMMRLGRRKMKMIGQSRTIFRTLIIDYSLNCCDMLSKFKFTVR